MVSNRLLLFTKYPSPGHVKTRLIPLLGSYASARLHKILTETAINTAFSAKKISDFSIEVHFSGADHTKMLEWLGSTLKYRKQVKGDLGDKMGAAFRKAFDEGVQKVIIIGSDVPDLTPSIIIQAFDELNSDNVVIGPASDGGYYLLGICHYYPLLFDHIEWSGPSVLNQTLNRITRLSLKVILLPILSDLDRPEDFIAFQKQSRFSNFA